MRRKKIYIASSWRHQHGVEMLTHHLRLQGHEVISWIENCNREGLPGFAFEEWVKLPEADRSFEFDTKGATEADLVIYYGAAGRDAAAELGAAWAAKRPIIGLWQKGEDFGLMRKMVSVWFYRWTDLLEAVSKMD